MSDWWGYLKDNWWEPLVVPPLYYLHIFYTEATLRKMGVAVSWVLGSN